MHSCLQTKGQNYIFQTLTVEWSVKPVREWQIKPSFPRQTSYEAPFKNAQLDKDKLEGKSHSLPVMHALYVLVSLWRGMRKGNLNQVGMRYGKTLTNPSGFLFIPCSHACKYSCYYSVVYFPDWEIKKSLSLPMLPHWCWRQAAYCCHISLWTMIDLAVNHQAMILFWCVKPHNSWLLELVYWSKHYFVKGKNILWEFGHVKQ